MCFQAFQSAFPTGSAVILKMEMNQRQSHDINTFLIYYRRRDTNQQKSMCDLSDTKYIFLENFHSSECVDGAEIFPVSTANKI